MRVRRCALPAIAAPLAALALCLAPSAVAGPIQVVVTQAPYSASGDGVTNDRAAIQQAIDDVCNNSGGSGGTVEIPANDPSGSVFLSGGSLDLDCSDITLQIDAGATLEQSQSAGDYSYTPVYGQFIGGPTFQAGMFENQPFVEVSAPPGSDGSPSSTLSNVTVDGGGTIRMTQTYDQQAYPGSGPYGTPPCDWASGCEDASSTIYNIPIGIDDVNGFTVTDLTIFNSDSTNLNVVNASGGTISYLTIDARHDLDDDGMDIADSASVNVSHNTIATGDDGIAIGSVADDPRFPTSIPPQPASNITVSDNSIESYLDHGFALFPWGGGWADPSQVGVHGLTVTGNQITADTQPVVWCWCDDPFHGGSGSSANGSYLNYQNESDPTPMLDITFSGNTYTGTPAVSMPNDVISNLVDDFPSGPQTALSSPVLFNGGFEDGGPAYWDLNGWPGSVVGTSTQQLGQDGARYAYLVPPSSDYRSFGQSVLLNGGETYTLSALTQTNGRVPFRMVAWNGSCSAQQGFVAYASSTSWALTTETFAVPSGCGGQWSIVFDNYGSGTNGSDWLHVDDVGIVGHVTSGISDTTINNQDPQVAYVGAGWVECYQANAGSCDYNAAAVDADVRESPEAGDTVTIPFVGTAADLRFATGPYDGEATVEVDGSSATEQTVDTYAGSAAAAQELWQVHGLAYGLHTVTITVLGQHDPSSTNSWVELDALELLAS